METCTLEFTLTEGRVSELIYGQFIEHLADCIDGGICLPGTGEANASVLEAVQSLQVPLLRFPGGTVVNIYHWEDAIGPKEQRKRRMNRIWGGELSPDFGTAEFVQYCRKIGAEPMLCINLASGTPEEAGNWVEYCNGTGHTWYADLRRAHGYPEPFGVKYWCIGNESYAEPDLGIQNDVQTYIRDAREYIKFMKLTDPTIRTVLVGCDNPAWNTAVLDALHEMTDYLSYHHYSGGGDTPYGPFFGEESLRSALRQLSELTGKYPEQVTQFNPWYRFPPRSGPVKIAVDEWNRWDFRQTEDYGLHMVFNWRDALWTASVLNDLLMCPSVGLANMAQMVNVIAPILVQDGKAYFQTTAYPLMAYRQHMTGRRLEITARIPTLENGLEALSLAGVLRDDGKICVAAVNRNLEKPICLRLPGIASCTVRTMTAPWNAHCTPVQSCVQCSEATQTGDNLELLPGSMNLIEWKI